MATIKLKKILDTAKTPTYGTKSSACFDIYAASDANIYPGDCVAVRTGLIFDIPEGYELLIRPRSGISMKTKLRIPNSPGTVDSDYKQEVRILLENISKMDLFKIKAGDRIAQGTLKAVEKVEFKEVDEVEDTGRGGFGSTGV